MAYVIGSDEGKRIANAMKAGESWTNPADGSKWSKQADGSVSVKTSKGETFNNAYTPTSNVPNVTGNGTVRYSGSSYGGGSSGGGGNSQYTQGNYSIGSDYGKQKAEEMGIGTEWIATDGSRWVKENDGTITVYHGGTQTNKAWTPSYYEPLQTSKDHLENYYQENPQPTAPQRDPRIDALLNQILNRDDFSYDVMNDPLYQQYAQMYQRESDRAMRNTMAEAAASAGGMNTYAMTAAMQANNYYNSQLNDKIPELCQLAYNMYLNDKESQVQDLGILQNMDNTQYNRYRDTMNDWYNDKNFAYGVYQDAVQQGNWQTQFNYNSNWDKIKWDYQLGRDQIYDNRYDSETSYEKDIYNKDTANARVEAMIEDGEMPSDELIAQTEWDKADVLKRVNAKRREKGLLPISNASGGYT